MDGQQAGNQYPTENAAALSIPWTVEMFPQKFENVCQFRD